MKNIKWNDVKVRISDNVSDEEDWTTYKLHFKGNDIPRVDCQKEIHKGIYGHDFIGMSMIELHSWQKFDATGTHPETYHEVFDWRRNRFRDFMSVIDIRQIVCGGCNE